MYASVDLALPLAVALVIFFLIERFISAVIGLFWSRESELKQAMSHQFLSSSAEALTNLCFSALYTVTSMASALVTVMLWVSIVLLFSSIKVVGLFPNRDERREALEAFRRIRDGVEQYVWVQTVTGLAIAIASWIAMAVIGLDNAIFWAFLIFIASYIPVIGGVIGVLAPPVFALIQFPSFWPAVILLAVLQVIQFVVGNIILPRMQGDSLNMDPVVVLLSLAFWGVIWGLAGMFLSTPLTVMAMIILAQFPGTRGVAILLSADGEPWKQKSKSTSRANSTRA